MKRLAEKVIEEKIKSRKKLDAKRKQTSVRFDGMRSERVLEEDEGDHHQVGIGRYDDEGDGFVVSDNDEEEELEKRAGRLSKIKSQGSQKYKDRRREDSEDEEEDEDDDELGDDDVYEARNEQKQDTTPRRSRRRIVDDEDEE